jgi:putative two-component system response regulator
MRDLQQARVLLVDDEPSNLLLLRKILTRAEIEHVEATSDPRDAAALWTEFRPDLLLLDLQMPHLDGFAVMGQIQDGLEPENYVPILILTADASAETKREALAQGAKDFLTKPFDATEVLLRIKNLLETRFLHLELKEHNRDLEERVYERTAELDQARLETLARLALAAEYRDDDTGEHTRRVGHAAALVADELGMDSSSVELIRRAAPLHDVGKIGIPDAVLLKPGKLTHDEFDHMKTHTEIGARILSSSKFTLLQLAEEVAQTHHERWDGSGYTGLTGDAIPVGGRIVAVVDVFDALTHERPYKRAWPVAQAVEEIESQKGRHFDPEVVDAFLAVQRRENLLILGKAPLDSEPPAQSGRTITLAREGESVDQA